MFISPGIMIFPSRLMILVFAGTSRDKTSVLPIAVMRELVTSRAPSRMMSRELLTVIMVQWVYNVDVELDIASDAGVFHISKCSVHIYPHIERNAHFYYISKSSISSLKEIRAFQNFGYARYVGRPGNLCTDHF